MKENEKLYILPNILNIFAESLGTKVRNRRIEIPGEFGKGYCAGFVFNEHIQMLFLNYELKENLIIENPLIDESQRMILFKFQHIISQPKPSQEAQLPRDTPSVLIGTSRMNTDSIIPIDTKTAAINIEVDANYLKNLFELSEKSPVLQSLLENSQPLLFEQMVYPSLRMIVDEIVEEIVSQSVNQAFEIFFLKIKAEELVCRLLMELEKRDEKRLYALNKQDITAAYSVKKQMLEHLDTPPIIKELAIQANMSPTKLKCIFKQIFGNSIFSYYQTFRIREAARLLKEENLSVSDAGYKMGFSNLSHFSRVFEEHIGMKPKQYSRS